MPQSQKSRLITKEVSATYLGLSFKVQVLHSILSLSQKRCLHDRLILDTLSVPPNRVFIIRGIGDVTDDGEFMGPNRPHMTQ
jgi:hypothetical protein